MILGKLFIEMMPARASIKMRKAKTVKIFLDDRGSFLGRGKGCLIVRDRKGNVEEYPLFENEIGEHACNN